MAVTLSPTSLTLHHASNHRPLEVFRTNRHLNFTKLRCTGGGDNSTSTDSSTSKSNQASESGNLLLKTAWYGSELLGIAASFFRSPEKVVERGIELGGDEDGDGVIDRTIIVETIKGDFQRSYFVTGDLTLDAYEDDCEFADPAGSFRGLRRFKRNCTNFGSLIQKSNMKLMKWEDYEEVQKLLAEYKYINMTNLNYKGCDIVVEALGDVVEYPICPGFNFQAYTTVVDKGIGHWRFSCTMSFPWKPILSATGYTEYYLSKESGKACGALECPKDGIIQTTPEA